MTEQSELTRTIHETNNLIKEIIETEDNVGNYFWTTGEIIKYYVSGNNHAYITIEQDGHSIRCVIWNSVLNNLSLELNLGFIVEVYGKLIFYTLRAEVEINVQKVRIIDDRGIVPKNEVINQLKEKGLWDLPKKKLSAPINHIVLMTSKSSIAIADFRNNYKKYGGKGKIELIEVQLEGEGASSTIANAILRASYKSSVDVIVLARGGGHNKELSIFNSYDIVEAIAKSEVPIVTGIGHDKDKTIADEVADVVTSTPNGAATELAKYSHKPEPEIVRPRKEIQPQPESNLNLILIIVGIIVIALLVILILRTF